MLKQEQLEATIKMLTLASAQIEATMIEAGQSIDELSSSFSEIAQQFHHLDGHEDETVVRVSREDFSQLRLKINQAIIAMQFYDRMTQRLHHINSGLSDTSKILENLDTATEQDWQKLQNMIRSNYTMESERNMFERIVAGTSLDEALNDFKRLTEKTVSKDNGDIELF
jgi:septal ring factor EnvC (AmiA/AmiB activator)